MIFPRFTDLGMIASELEANPRYKALFKTISSAMMAQSCAADIAQATDCCKTLANLLASPRKKGTLERSTTENSLLANAIILYARATAAGNKGGGRGSIQIISKLTPQQRIDHDILVAIRNRAVAHVHTAQPIAGELWHNELMMAVESEQGWRPASASQRVQFDKPTFVRLGRQLPVAYEIVLVQFQKRVGAVTNMLNDASIPAALFETHQFDPVEQFGSISAVQQLLSGQVTGHASALAHR